MKKLKFLLIAGLSLSFFISCTQKDTLPQNPKDKEKHVDSQGNSWIYNAALMRWALMPHGSGSPSYYYYPGSNSWTNGSGTKVNPPAGISESTYRPASVKPNSTTKTRSYNRSSKPASRSFGKSVSPSRSFGA